MPRSLRFWAVVLACTWMATACASSARSTADAAAAMCMSHLPPHEAPLAAALDSAALVGDLLADWGTTPHGRTVASVMFNAAGGVDSVTVLSQTMPDATKERIANTLRRHANPGQGRSRVDLFIGDSVEFAPRRVRTLLRCAPQVASYDALREALLRETREIGRQGVLRNANVLSATVWLRTADDGQVAETRVVRSSGRVEADEAARRVIASATFLPAKVEGIAVPGWAEIPVNIQIADPGPPPPPRPPPRIPTVPGP